MIAPIDKIIELNHDWDVSELELTIPEYEVPIQFLVDGPVERVQEALASASCGTWDTEARTLTIAGTTFTGTVIPPLEQRGQGWGRYKEIQFDATLTPDELNELYRLRRRAAKGTLGKRGEQRMGILLGYRLERYKPSGPRPFDPEHNLVDYAAQIAERMKQKAATANDGS